MMMMFVTMDSHFVDLAEFDHCHHHHHHDNDDPILVTPLPMTAVVTMMLSMGSGRNSSLFLSCDSLIQWVSNIGSDIGGGWLVDCGLLTVID